MHPVGTDEEARAADKAPSTQVEDVENKNADSTASALAGGLTLLSAGLGVFGGLSGAVARMARNHQEATGTAVVLVLGSVVLALASRLVSAKVKVLVTRGPRLYLLLLWLALAAFVSGVALAMMQLNASLGADDRPSVSATTTRDSAGVFSVTGKAQAGGLAAADRIYVSLVAFNQNQKQREQIYYALVGPNQEGLVDHTFSVVLTPSTKSVVISAGKVTRANAEDNRRNNMHPVCEPPLPRSPTASPQPGSADVTPPNTLTACALVRVADLPTATAS